MGLWEQRGPSWTCLAQALLLIPRPRHEDVMSCRDHADEPNGSYAQGETVAPLPREGPPKRRAAWPRGGQDVAIAGRVSVGCDCHPGDGTDGVPAGVWCHTTDPGCGVAHGAVAQACWGVGHSTELTTWVHAEWKQMGLKLLSSFSEP